MVRPRLSDGFTRVANGVAEGLMFRDFSKRQRKILDLIFRLSFGCNRETAVIPKLSDFEIVGVDRSDIGGELRWLQESKVIFREGIQYTFNQDVDEWQVSRVRRFAPERLAGLLRLNLSMVGERPTDIGEIPTSIENMVGKTPTSQLVKDQCKGWQNANPPSLEVVPAKDTVKTLKDSSRDVNREGDDAFRKRMRENERYASLDVDHEWERYAKWCEEGRKSPSHLRFIDWLDREAESRSQEGDKRSADRWSIACTSEADVQAVLAERERRNRLPEDVRP